MINEHHWEVILNNGEVISQDDNAPGLWPPSAWVRLGNYLKSNPELKIVEYGIRNNALYIPLPTYKDGYYFSKGCLQGVGGGDLLEYYVMGYLDGGIVNNFWIRVPDLAIIERENRSEKDCCFPMLLSLTTLAS